MHENRPRSRVVLRRRRPLTFASGVLASGLLVSIIGFAVATGDATGDAAAASGDSVASVAILVPDERLDPRIVSLELTGTAWSRAVDRLDQVIFDAAENERRLENSRRQLDDLGGDLTSVALSQDEATTAIAELSDELAEVESILQERALDRYVHFGDETLASLTDPINATDAGRSASLGRRADEVQFSTRADLLRRRDEAVADELLLSLRAVELTAEIASTSAVIEERHGSVAALATDVTAAREAVKTARWTAAIPGIDISVVAFDAYLNAEALLTEDAPTCGIRWWMIAGVARIESRHGTFGGRNLRADGRVSRSIIGIALDGSPGVRAMIDTDDGVFDGDDVWDRAVGPLQFIPETWNRRGRDGSGDGYADPQNIYDAAYSAGRYLCALGGDIGTRSALKDAYFGYNNSSAYVADVVANADRYSAFELPLPVDSQELEQAG